MYTSELMVWLWTILMNGKSCYPYNVGSEKVITIEELAILISNSFDEKIEVEILAKKNITSNSSISRYIPSTNRAQTELDLNENIFLETAIKKTIEFFKRNMI